MCIVLISTAHPSYPFILINNRDEFLRRPTAQASFWPHPLTHVLGGRDLLRPVHGTWLGVTLDGRIACLTNFREEGSPSHSLVSRGAMVKAFLDPSVDNVPSTEQFVSELLKGEGARGSGGFTLLCGKLGERLAVISNRTQEKDEISWVGARAGETVGVSNAAFGDRTWKKVTIGEELMAVRVRELAEREATKDEIIRDLIHLLETNTLPEWTLAGSLNSVVKELRKSIFIPKLGSSEEGMVESTADAHSRQDVMNEEATTGSYGTQKQTVILVDVAGTITFVEKTLYDERGKDISGKPETIRRFEFNIRKQFPN